MEFQTIPIMRIFGEGKAKEFYPGFLGMELDWDHRFKGGYGYRGCSTITLAGQSPDLKALPPTTNIADAAS